MTRAILLFVVVCSLLAAFRGACAGRIKRIVGGLVAEPHEFPYQASLRFFGIHICGGVLVSKRHVVSAAHCICGLLEPPYEELTIVTGTNKLKTDGQIHEVERVTCHPKYVYGMNDSWTHDISVVTLKEEIEVSNLQSPIGLPSRDVPVGVKAVLSGWGRDTLGGYLAKNLHHVSLTTLSNEECQQYYDFKILPCQVCTFEGKGRGACKGDSGSPLVYNGELVGIFSWTKPCALGSPDVYSRVHYFRDFIVQEIEKDNCRNSSLNHNLLNR